MRAVLLRVVVVAVLASTFAGVGTSEAASTDPELSESADPIWMTNGLGKVLAIAGGGTRVFVAGSFTGMQETYAGSPISQGYVAALDMWTGDFLPEFDPVVDGEVRAVAVSPDAQTVYIGGTFDEVNGQTRTKLAALDATTGNLKGNFDVAIPVGNIEAIAVKSNGDLFIGGSFNSVNGQGQNSLALLKESDGSLRTWDAVLNPGKVTSLLLLGDESRLYVGTSILVGTRFDDGEFLALDPLDGTDIEGFDASNVDRPVLDISVSEEKIYLALGGGGGAADILRASNGSRRQRYITDGDVQSVLVVGDTAYFAGHWVANFGSNDSFRFQGVSVATDNVDDAYSPGISGTGGLQDMFFDGVHLWAGGDVTDASPVSVRGFARYTAVAASGPLTPLIDQGAEWKYLDDGSWLLPAWRDLDYDDSGWREGDAELGYGDGDEETVVRDGPNSNRYITTYFRRVVTVYNEDITFLDIELKRDDGAVVYINGTEVVRDNMPGGVIQGGTLASSGVNGSAEDAFNRFIISPGVLQQGENIVAVEVHQRSATSVDISFDLKMSTNSTPEVFIDSGATWLYRDDGPSLNVGWRNLGYDDSTWKEGPSQLGYGEGDEATAIGNGPAGGRYITSYFRRVFAVYDLAAVSTLELELLRDDGAIVYLNGTKVVRSNMPSGAVDSETRALKLAAYPDEQDWYRYSLNPNLLVEGDNIITVEIHQKGPGSNDHSFDLRLLLQASDEQLLDRDMKWRYHDKGKDKGTSWRELGYANHLNWKKGRAELGYGDGDETKVVNSGPQGDFYPTIYFRRFFQVTDPDVFSVLDIGLIRDDGAVIYVNGVEVLRENMPTGTITYNTFASGGVPDETEWQLFTVPANMLVVGTNSIAVEVHQSGPSSSDLSFNLDLTGR